MSAGCCVCGKGPQDQVALYRASPMGGPAVWSCESHLEQAGAPQPAPEVVDIVRAVSGEGAGHVDTAG